MTYMNDFFTELDSDLLDTKKTSAGPENHTAEAREYSCSIEDNYEAPPLPVTEKREPKESRQKKGSYEEGLSNFSMTGTVASVFPRSKPQSFPVLLKGQTRLVAIGGQNESGKNMIMCQYGDEALLLGGGIQLPKSGMLGAKYSLPDISLLFSLKKKISGIVITSGHIDHIGGLKHILPALGYPKVYGTGLTIALIKQQMEDAGMLQKIRFHTVDPDTDGIFPVSASMKMEFFRQNSNIPDAVGVYIETPSAKLVYSGDFTFDPVPAPENQADFEKIRKIGTRGIDMLMSDSTNSMKEGFAKTEAEIGKELHEIIMKTEGRIIVSMFASLIGRMGQIIGSAEKAGRTVFLNGRSMVENMNIGRNCGFIKCNPDSVKRITNKADSVPDNRQIILTTGSQGEADSGLYRMVHEEHPIVKIRPGDTVILSSASGNEQERENIMNSLIRLGAILFTKDGMDIHSGGHASRKEQRIMIDLIRPRNFMPVHGELFMRVAHKKVATEAGLGDRNIFLSDNGSILDIDGKGGVIKYKIKLHTEEVIVDGYGIGIATSHVIEARAQMMEAGVVTIVFKADEKSRTLLGHLKLETRGLVYLDEVREVHKMIIKKARASYEDTMKDIPDIEEKDLIKIIRRDMEIFLLHKIGRNPVIIPMILSV